MKQLSDCCKAEIKLTGKDRPNAFACSKCGRIIGTPIKKQKPKEYVALMRQTKTNVAESKKSATPKELEWEKEFEIKYGRNSGRLTFYNEQKYYWNNKFYDEVKDFISQTLTQQRTELLEEIKGKLKEEFKEYEVYPGLLEIRTEQFWKFIKSLVKK